MLLTLWQRNGYWNFSDGVYAMSAREWLHGLVPYRDFAAAQPPPVFLAGLGLLAVHDGLYSLRIGLGLVDLVTALLAGQSVWRLTRSRELALATVVIAPLLPVTLHEHAQLTPETLAAPLLLAGALTSSRSAKTPVSGLLLALAAACKVAFAIPALAIVLASPQRRRATLALVLAGTAMGLASLAVFGPPLWREVVEAQTQVGTPSGHYIGTLVGQIAWNEFPLIVGAGLALWLLHRGLARVADPALLSTIVAAAVAGLLMAATFLKRGSYINVMAIAEPPLLVLAMCGAAWSWRAARSRLLLTGVIALLAAQVVSILVSPADPVLAGSGMKWAASLSSVRRQVAAARACPAGVPYPGPPYLAFLADRPMPGAQPDLFMLKTARIDAPFARRAARDRPRCPRE